MKRFLKWTALVLFVVAGLGLCAFLYNIPPFFLVSPEDFGKQMALAAPPVTNIPNPALRAIA